MDKNQSQISSKKLLIEALNLTPSTLITMFEIDLTDILFDTGIITQVQKDFNLTSGLIFRFHNNIKLMTTSIFWKGLEYIACPIQATEFELSTSGTLPVPKLQITTGPEGIDAIGLLRQRLAQLGDLSGAKVTRIRTFLKFIDSINFPDGIFPQGFSPDSNAEFPRDIYFIDRKSQENKYGVQYDLASLIDIEGVKLPGRLCIQNTCSWSYRGEGCLYEFSSRKTPIHKLGTLPSSAPPVANINSELFSDILPNIALVDKGLYDINNSYSIGDYVFITKNNLNYYFVCVYANPPAGPPNSLYWIQDNCSKSNSACSIRWAKIGNGNLPTSSFPGINKLNQ